METTTLTLSIGALVTLGAVAAGYGAMRNSIKTLADNLLKMEREGVERDDKIRKLELWKAEQRGKENAHRKSRKTREASGPHSDDSHGG